MSTAKNLRRSAKTGEIWESHLSVCVQHALAEVFVIKASEIGVVDKQYSTISHLGHLLHPGDTVMG